MATPPASTKASLGQRLHAHARLRWPALTEVTVRHHGAFAYVAGHLPDGTVLPLFRLRYNGYANRWGFAIWLASRDGYEDSVLLTGYPLRHRRRSPRLRLRPLPQRPHRLATRIDPTNLRLGPLSPDPPTGVPCRGLCRR